MKVNSLIKGSLGKAGLVLKKYSPEILMVVGAAGTIGAAVLTGKATLKATEVLEETKQDLKDIKVAHATCDEEMYSEGDYKTDLTKAYVKTGLSLVKLYAPAIILETLSLGAMFSSNKQLRKRNGYLVAAYGTLEGMYNKYRSNVIEAFGEETDFKMRNSIKSEKVEVIEVDEDGNEHTVKKKVDICTDDGIVSASRYARFFDKNNPEWEKDPEYNKNYLLVKQRYFNDLLRARGHVFLNEVYDALGYKRTDYGQVVGWTYRPMDEDDTADGYIDFGIFDVHKSANRDFVNGYEPVILLDFNVDGNIMHEI